MRNECRNEGLDRQFTRAGLRLLPAAALLFATATLAAQAVSPRLRGTANHGAATPPAAQPQVPATPPAVPPPTSLLQQPAQPAQVTLSGQHLSIHADNSSLSAILRDIAGMSGMKIEGLGSDERVFGTFGPGAPRDVIADLLNGTAYNVVLLGDLSNGAPRELILTQSSHGGAANPAPAAPANNNEDNEQDQPDPQPEPPPQAEQPVNPQQPPGSVRTPQQLFEQLQRMRQNQAQQPSDQQQQQQQAPPPQQ